MHRGWPATAIPGGRDSGGRRGVGGRLGGGSWMGMLRAGSFVPRDVWPVRGRRLLSESWSCVWAWALPAACTFLSGEGWARHLGDATDGVLGFLCSGFPTPCPVRIRFCGRRPEGADSVEAAPSAHQALCSSNPVLHQCRCLILGWSADSGGGQGPLCRCGVLAPCHISSGYGTTGKQTSQVGSSMAASFHSPQYTSRGAPLRCQPRSVRSASRPA